MEVSLLVFLCIVVLVNAYISLTPLKRLGTRLFDVDDIEGKNKAKVARLMDFLADCEGWGPCRFVVQGEGAILEAMGAIDDIRYSENPKTGAILITLSRENLYPGFECHLRCEEISKVTHSVVSKFEKTLRVTRFLGEEDKNLLSVILNGEEGVHSWEQTRQKYGDSFIL